MRGEPGGEGGGGEFLGEDVREEGEGEEGRRGDVAMAGFSEGEGEPDRDACDLVGDKGNTCTAEL